MKPYDVAVEAAKLARARHLSFHVEVERVPDAVNGNTYAWVSNGYGVSLITYPRDTYPEILVCRKHDGGWHLSHSLVAPFGKGTIRTDPIGNLRNVTPDMLVEFLDQLAWWNEGRDWRYPVTGSAG